MIARRDGFQTEIVEQSLRRGRRFFLRELPNLHERRLDGANAGPGPAFHRGSEIEAVGARGVHADDHGCGAGRLDERRGGGEREELAAIHWVHRGTIYQENAALDL